MIEIGTVFKKRIGFMFWRGEVQIKALFQTFIFYKIGQPNLAFSRCPRYIGDHPYITSARGLGGWVENLAIFADFQ